jgi:hypothetical protein
MLNRQLFEIARRELDGWNHELIAKWLGVDVEWVEQVTGSMGYAVVKERVEGGYLE